jgi:hypothetical protein
VTRAVSNGLGRTWLKVGTGLPNAPITELRWHAPTSTLFAANFGRGAYSVRLPGLGSGAAQSTTPSTGNVPVAAPRPVVGQLPATGSPLSGSAGWMTLGLLALAGVLTRSLRRA